MKYFILFMLICSVCLADPVVLRVKPNIPADKELDVLEKAQVKEYLGGKIFKELMPAKNDYKDKYDRGTVEFNPTKGVNILGREVFAASNYSFQKVVVPDGTYLKDINFTQKEPYTEAIIGKNLTFEGCNLTNVKPDPTWKYVGGCGTVQIKRVLKSQVDNGDGTYTLVISHQTEKEGRFVEIAEYEENVWADDLQDALDGLNKE
jgi:hypothetical protein